MIKCKRQIDKVWKVVVNEDMIGVDLGEKHQTLSKKKSYVSFIIKKDIIFYVQLIKVLIGQKHQTLPKKMSNAF